MTRTDTPTPSDVLAQGHSLRQWSDAIAEATAVPGGGSAVAIAASLAASVLVMCLGLTLGRKRFEGVEAEFQDLRKEADEIRENLILLAEEDVVAYGTVTEARGLPHSNRDESALRLINLNNALLGASDVQLTILRLCRNLVATARRVYQAGNPSVKADAAAVIFLAAGAGRAAQFNVEANLDGLGWATEVGLAEAVADGGVRPEQVDELLNEAARLTLELEREERALGES
jgi:formiminotetrahydrofolate cyclodeaminase